MGKDNIQMVNYLDDIFGYDTWNKENGSFWIQREVLDLSGLREAKVKVCRLFISIFKNWQDILKGWKWSPLLLPLKHEFFCNHINVPV